MDIKINGEFFMPIKPISREEFSKLYNDVCVKNAGTIEVKFNDSGLLVVDINKENL